MLCILVLEFFVIPSGQLKTPCMIDRMKKDSWQDNGVGAGYGEQETGCGIDSASVQ